MKIFIYFFCIASWYFSPFLVSAQEENSTLLPPAIEEVNKVIKNVTQTNDIQTTDIFNVKKDIDKEKQKLTEFENENEFDQKELETLKEEKEVIIREYGVLFEQLLGIEKQVESAVENDEIFIIEDSQKVKIYDAIVDLYKKIGKENTLESAQDNLLAHKTQLETDFGEWKEKTEEKIKNLADTIEKRNEQIKDLESTLGKKRNIFSSLVLDYVERIGKFLLLICGVLLIFKLIHIFLKKHISSRLSNQAETIFFVFGWVRNITVLIIAIVFFFSEFTKFLPFLAILGTALGFALRDIISCIIAWFLLGYRDSLYKIGDIIEIEGENIFGKVTDISPTITTISAYGLSGPSGRELSFPNKFVFEKSVKNSSKYNKWLYVTIDILFESGANFDDIEDAVRIANNDFKEHFSISDNVYKHFYFMLGIHSKDYSPKILYDNFSHGLRVRVKTLALLKDMIPMKSYLTKRILEEVQKKETLRVRYIDFPQGN